MMVRGGVVQVAFVVLLNAGCSSSEDGASATSGGAGGTGGSAAGAPSRAGASAADAPVGTFTVLLDARSAITKVSGVVRDAPAVEAVPFVPDEKSGDCQLFLPKPPFCDPACSSDQVCTPENVCRPRPVNRSVGTVTVRGLSTASGASEFTMEPVGSSKAYGPSGSVSIAYPPAAAGAEVRLSAAGGDYPPFEMSTTAVGPVEGFGGDPLPLERDVPLALSWVPEAGSRVEALLEIAHHGGEKGRVYCSAADTGSLMVPAPLVTKLMGLGVAGFPDVTLTRKSVGSTFIDPGRIDFIVFASSNREIAIEGLTSCLTDEDCGAGEVCGQDKACRAARP